MASLTSLTVAHLIAIGNLQPEKKAIAVTRAYINPKEGDKDPVAEEVVIVIGVGYKAANEVYEAVKGQLDHTEDLLELCGELG